MTDLFDDLYLLRWVKVNLHKLSFYGIYGDVLKVRVYVWKEFVSSSVNNKDYLMRPSCFVSASLHNLTEKPAASSQKHMAEQRRKVVTEIVNTERDYCNDLELCVKHCLAELQSAQVRFVIAMLNFCFIFSCRLKITRFIRKSRYQLLQKPESSLSSWIEHLALSSRRGCCSFCRVSMIILGHLS